MPDGPPRPAGIPDVDDPAPLLRIMAMVRGVLEETRSLALDDHAREQLRDLQRRVLDELVAHLGPELRDELRSVRLSLPDDRVPNQTELRIAQAGLVGWLDGLFHGAQMAIAAQQSAAAAQLARLRRDATTRGAGPAPTVPASGSYL